MKALVNAPWPLPGRQAFILGLAMWVAAGLTIWITPERHEGTAPPNLEASVPTQFGDWTAVPNPMVPANLAVAADGQASTDQPYDQTVLRSYRNSRGDIVMLALAYGRSQRQEVKIHRPELCYPAQGFDVQGLQSTAFDAVPGTHQRVTGKQMLARSGQRMEAVSYWIRIGRVYSDSAWRTRWHIFTEGLQGRVPDGILVRASRPVSGVADAAQAYPALAQFMTELVQASPPATRDLMVR